MKLSKNEALIAYTCLHQCLQKDSFGYLSGLTEDAEDLMFKIRDYILNEGVDDQSSSEEDETHQEESEEPESVSVDPEDHISALQLCELPSAVVVVPTGDRVALEFSESELGLSDVVDVHLDDGSVIIESITCIKMTDNSIELYDGDEWHSFGIHKLPKAWKKLISADVVYGFKTEN